MAASRPQRPSTWPDLPCDLLGVVLRGLPSLADRVRLRAVCRPWRLSAAPMLHQSPPQLPWLAFHDGTLLDVSNNNAHRVRLPDDGASCYCAGENMLFILHGDRRCSLLNTFSGDVTPLPELATRLKGCDVKSTHIMKVVVSSAPEIVAVLFRSTYGSGVLASICRPDGKIQSCQVLRTDRYIGKICDIVIFGGKIHAITREDCKLLGLQLHNNEKRPRFSRRILCASDLPPRPSPGIHEVKRYLVESNSKLLMVRRWISNVWYFESAGWDRELSVVEADLSSGQWNKVDALEGQALFVSRQCSKSVPAAAGARQDCIYFLDEYGNGDSGAYSMGDRTITPLLPEEPATPLLSNRPPACPAWFFPVEV